MLIAAGGGQADADHGNGECRKQLGERIVGIEVKHAAFGQHPAKEVADGAQCHDSDQQEHHHCHREQEFDDAPKAGDEYQPDDEQHVHGHGHGKGLGQKGGFGVGVAQRFVAFGLFEVRKRLDVPDQRPDIHEGQHGNGRNRDDDGCLQRQATGGESGRNVLEHRHRTARARHPEQQEHEERGGQAASAQGGQKIKRRVIVRRSCECGGHGEAPINMLIMECN